MSLHDFSLCAIDYIIAHPDYSTLVLSKAIGISTTSAQRLKRELGLPIRTRPRRQTNILTKELIALRCNWDVPKTAAELDRCGYKVTLRQVQQLCGERPWTKQQVEQHIGRMKRRRA